MLGFLVRLANHSVQRAPYVPIAAFCAADNTVIA